MWYLSPSQDRHDEVAPKEMVVVVEPDLRLTALGDVKSSAPGISAKTRVRSQGTAVSSGPGTEYWLP